MDQIRVRLYQCNRDGGPRTEGITLHTICRSDTVRSLKRMLPFAATGDKVRYWIQNSAADGQFRGAAGPDDWELAFANDVTMPDDTRLGAVSPFNASETVYLMVEQAIDGVFPRDDVLARWRQGLQVGAIVDAMDTDKRWYAAVIVGRDDALQALKVHYQGWSEKWDAWIGVQSNSIHKLYTMTTRWRENLQVGSRVDVNHGSQTGRWFQGIVVSVIGDDIAVSTPPAPGTLRCDRWSEMICEGRTHAKHAQRPTIDKHRYTAAKAKAGTRVKTVDDSGEIQKPEPIQQQQQTTAATRQLIQSNLLQVSETGDLQQLQVLAQNFPTEIRDAFKGYHEPVLAAAHRGDVHMIQALFEAGATCPPLESMDLSGASPITIALLKKQTVVPPTPQYGHDNLVELWFGQSVPAVLGQPQFLAEELALVESFELNGELPSGVTFDVGSGVLSGVPTAVPFDGAIVVRSRNSLAGSEDCVFRLTVTSDMRQLLSSSSVEHATAILRLYPTVTHFRDWFQGLDESDRPNAIDVVLTEDVRVGSATQRLALKGLLRTTLVAEQQRQPPLELENVLRAESHVAIPAVAAVPHVTAGSYHIATEHVILRSQINCGGSVHVYEANWRKAKVAVKVFPLGLQHNAPLKVRAAIEQEIGQLNALCHPHIVQLYGFFQDDWRTGMVMELCGDGDLTLFSHGKPLLVKLDVAQQMLAGLDYLHSLEPPVTHGNIKPQNVLIQHGQAKLADVGMATGAIRRAGEAVQMGASSNPYSAPEVLTHGRRALSPASDMFSFGMLVYYLVEEEVPWSGEEPGFIFRQVTSGILPSFESAGWTLELQEFVQGCCAFDAESRLAAEESYQALAEKLQSVVANDNAEQNCVLVPVTATQIL